MSNSRRISKGSNPVPFLKSPDVCVGTFFILGPKLAYICGMAMMVLFISGAEIFFILFVVVMVFGADKIPGIARGLGQGMRQLKDATEDIKREIQKSAEKQGIDTSFTKEIQQDLKEVKKNLDDVTGTISRKK